MPPQPIIVAPTPTPFTKDESIDHALLAESVEKWCLTELSGFVLGTYGGEEFHLGEPDKLSIIDTVVQAHQGRRFVIAGIDTLSPTEAVRLAGLYAEHGADFVCASASHHARHGLGWLQTERSCSSTSRR